MTDTVEAERGDDAPASTAKDLHGARDVVGRAVTINRSAADLYAYFRNFSNLPGFMENIVRIDVIDAKSSHWVVKGPGDTTYEWDATVTHEVENESITWQSAEGADVSNSGKVTFVEAGARGTVVTATIAYDPPAGAIGKIVAKLFQREPGIQARRDLRRFKQLMETGEIATSARTRKQHEPAIAAHPCDQWTDSPATVIVTISGMEISRVSSPSARQMHPAVSVAVASNAINSGAGILRPPCATGAPNHWTSAAKPVILACAPS